MEMSQNTFNFKSFQVAIMKVSYQKSLELYFLPFSGPYPQEAILRFFHNLNLYVKGGKMDVQSQRRCVEVSGKSVPVQLNLWPSD